MTYAKKLIKILRAINELLVTKDVESKIKYFKKIIKYISKTEVLANKRVDIEIRENKITNIMATDLISDNIYVQDIVHNLFSVAKILFINDKFDNEKEEVDIDNANSVLDEDLIIDRNINNQPL